MAKAKKSDRKVVPDECRLQRAKKGLVAGSELGDIFDRDVGDVDGFVSVEGDGYDWKNTLNEATFVIKEKGFDDMIPLLNGLMSLPANRFKFFWCKDDAVCNIMFD